MDNGTGRTTRIYTKLRINFVQYSQATVCIMMGKPVKKEPKHKWKNISIFVHEN